MPEISRFYGIVIRMYFDDHSPPHFHAIYNGQEAVISINDLSVIRGQLSARAYGLVMEWAYLHRSEILEAWKRAKSMENPGRIAPLD